MAIYVETVICCFIIDVFKQNKEWSVTEEKGDIVSAHFMIITDIILSIVIIAASGVTFSA